MTARELIVNADDFGLSSGTNAGIVRAHEDGIVTSASLMVCWPDAVAAAEYGRARPQLSVGLHIDLGEWAYRDDEWVLVYENVPAEEEIPRQIERFRELMGRDPTHLDSHQHVHREEPVAGVVRTWGERLGVPIRDCGEIRYRGEFYGQTGKGHPVPEGIEPAALIALIEGLGPGTTELGCHPGLDAELRSSYRDERLREVQTLCDPRVRAALDAAGVVLRSF